MILEYLKLFRVIQWIKNGFLFFPLVYSKHLFQWDYLKLSLLAFIVFCFFSSIVYVINDIVDAPADRNHPVKKNRPIAAGKIKPITGLFSILILLFITIPILLFLPFNFFLLSAAFLFLNIVYTFSLKHIVLLDIFSIAAGFMIRITAGAVAIDVEISNWLILTTMFLSLFLAVMKRRSELELYLPNSVDTRKVLAEYSTSFIDQMATVAAAGVIICYALYTVSSRTVTIFNTENLIYTTPFVVFGIFRYMYLVIKDNKGENTSIIMLTDVPMILNIIFYSAITVLIVYHIL